MDADEILRLLELDCRSSVSDLIKIAKTNYKRLAFEHHPDRGGDPDKFIQIVDAYTYFNMSEFQDWLKTNYGNLYNTNFENFKQLVMSGQLTCVRDLDRFDLSANSRAMYARWIKMADASRFVRPGALLFFPEEITLGRFYRIYSLRTLSQDSAEFKLIQEYYLQELKLKFRRF